MLKLWVLIIVTVGSGVGSVEFRDQQQCEAARAALVAETRRVLADEPSGLIAVCAQKTIGGP